MQSNTQDKTPQIILGIPGQWKDRQDFLKSVIESSDFIFAGNVLYHPPSDRGLIVDLYNHDPRLQRAFAAAGWGRIDDEVLTAIASHTMTPYVIGPGGSFENAKFMAQAGAAILKAGGLAVKIESAGTAHSRGRWLKLVDEELLISGLHAFVAFVQGDDFYSCGMHAFGYRDAEFPKSPPDAIEHMSLFLRYTMTPEKPIADRDTVTLGPTRYRLRSRPCERFPEGDPFHNPYGIWCLEPA